MPLFVRPNQEWSMIPVSDALANGRALRALTLWTTEGGSRD